MLCLIPIVGGLLIMMGQHDRCEALFYYFRLEDQVPENHLLRLIEKHVSFAFVREKLKASYSEISRPSIDPELLLRILLIGYLYGITSERKLVEELRMHLAWRWFTGLGFDQEIPHHSTFSKNRHGRFQESKLFEQLFEQIVKQCVKVGLIQGKHLSVDGSFVEANAAKGSRIPREKFVEAAQVHHTVRKYLQELEQQNPAEEPVHQQEQVSTTDPDSTYATKGGTPARLGYYDNYLVDNHSCVIVGVQATAARMSQETVAAQDMIACFAQWQGREPTSVAAIGRSRRSCLARPPFLDSSVLPSLVLPRSRNCGCQPDSYRSTPAELACRPWWRKSSPDRWSIPVLADAPVLLPGSAVPVPADTYAQCDGPGPLPPTVPVESDFLWQRSPLRSCHPPTDVSPVSVPLSHTASRSVQTTARTASIPETVHAGFSKT